jgi:hypothetical protein
VVSTTRDAIWRDVPGANKGLYHAGALSNKGPSLAIKKEAKVLFIVNKENLLIIH